MSMMYKVCKRTIERGNYSKDMTVRVKAFYEAKLITTEEYDKLMGMLG